MLKAQEAQEEKVARKATEKRKKSIKISDLKTFVETKLLSKSEKALEKCGLEQGDDKDPSTEQV